jgi:hypothetical protein
MGVAIASIIPAESPVLAIRLSARPGWIYLFQLRKAPEKKVFNKRII